MLPLKLVRSLVSGDDVTNPLFLCIHHHNLEHESDDNEDPTLSRNKTPLMLFLPNQELVRDTYRLASIARAIGMDLQPNPSLSHIIFSWPSPPPPQSCTLSSSSTSPHSWASSSAPSSSLSYSWSLPDGSVPLPFPSFATASLSHLRLFVSLSKGYFKLAFLKNGCTPLEKIESFSNNNWHCTSLSLFAASTGERVESMDGFSRALLGKGWALFKTNCGSERDFQDSTERELYLYKKLDASRICRNGDLRECSRARELRLPALDFRNAPLRILQYILLMTDDVFYLA
ncbi:uncharacterized protein LOC130990014 [Salvia miltiorrhiza]|uniref:uncharacterized protein LOC130990014 n=1 Tax=Salvia miltiorrhiza TaxID=226208 RepID=UPI0025AD3C13|nr:uncharacterized protein LOC130990014 [Salvia miltiorrhiza]XP_057770191.1 uncharacterized protein LOC130990014 [Salvia miltiorrhiza]XP_057770192.1 uncharacterized protein LOC130990014 [Salvia miltiorrhiza]